MSKPSLRNAIGDPRITDKPVPTSGKYQDVTTKLNTGGNVLKMPEKKERKDEVFKRMKTQTLARLIADPNAENQVIVLDVRDRDDFDICHISTAVSHPHTLLSRTVNPFLPVAFENKNKPHTIIVVYDMEERIAPITATIMFQKGFDNVMLLTGGLKKYLEDGFDVWGTPPAPPKTPSTAGSRRSTVAIGTSSGGGSCSGSVVGSSVASRATAQHGGRWK